MRDWISVPKTNGYESLHTTVVGPDGRWVEVQIRTDRMNEVAEKGFAAHWKYKGIKSEQSLDDWLLKIRDILETPEQSENVIDSFKMNLYNKEVFVFTPNGDLKKFPHGSCLLDFAYDIHSDLGDTCIGGKINGKNITIKYVLQNGDIISVNTSKKQFPKPDWLGFVKTTKAKARVKQYLKEVKLKDADDGKEMLVRRLKNWKVPMSDKLFFDMIKAFKYKNALDFYSDIAKEKISLQDVKTYINSLTPKDDKVVKAEVVENHVVQPQSTTTSTSSDFLEIDNKLVNVDYKFARCCNPVMGDRVFGFITIGDGIKIHRDDCPNALQLKKSYPYRIVEVKWKDTDEQTSFLVNVKILGSGSGIMSSVTDIITKDPKVSMRAFFIDSDTVGEFAGRIQINVSDLKHLDYILRKILSVKGVIKASRMNS
jgi:GTP pyrophosphokinase